MWRLACLAWVLLVVALTGVAAADSILDPSVSDLLAPRPIHVGELVTIVVTDNITTNMVVANKSDTSSTLTAPSGSGLLSVFPGIGWATEGVAARTEASQTQSWYQNTVTSRVVEVLPGGVLVLQAETKMRVDGKLRHLVFRGKVRRAEIPQSNIVASDKFADAELLVDGNQASPNGSGGILHWLLSPFR